jgi:hypothetical protein
MTERFEAVDEQNRNVILVSFEQFRIAFNVDFLERVKFGTAGAGHLLFHFFAEMTAGFTVDDDLDLPLHMRLASFPAGLRKTDLQQSTSWFSVEQKDALITLHAQLLPPHHALFH